MPLEIGEEKVLLDTKLIIEIIFRDERFSAQDELDMLFYFFDDFSQLERNNKRLMVRYMIKYK